VARVRHADAEAALRGRRHERQLPVRQAPKRFEDLARLPDQRVRLRRRLHPGRRADEQRITQLAAQLAEPDADRGLALLEQIGRARHAARRVEQVEELELPEIEQLGGVGGRILHCTTQYTHLLHCMYSMAAGA